jgi:hypothetical protein
VGISVGLLASLNGGGFPGFERLILEAIAPYAVPALKPDTGTSHNEEEANRMLGGARRLLPREQCRWLAGGCNQFALAEAGGRALLACSKRRSSDRRFMAA